MARTLYDILGVARGCSTTEIEAAYRERMEEFKEKRYAGADSQDHVRDAYRVLSNPVTRHGYDDTLPAARAPAREESPGLPAWVKIGAPLAVFLVALGWWKLRPKPEMVMEVKSVTRVQGPAVDPTAPAPVTIPDPVPGGLANAVPAPEGINVVSAPPGAVGTAESVFAAVAGSVARVRATDTSGAKQSQGSGVVIAPGTVITNCHVTKDANDIAVKVGNTEYRAAVALADEEFDLCRLSVQGLEAPAVATASVKQLRTGQRVFAIGAPQGLELTISEGIVSSLRESAQGTVVQTTAAISPGSSGGGLFDAGGRLVGIVTFQHRFGQNLNFAVPVDWINEMQPRIR